MVEKLPDLLRRALYDVKGTSLIETAFLIPILIGLFAGLMDFTVGFSEKLKTQQAATRAIEMVTMVGLEGAVSANLRAEAAAAADVPEEQVEVRLWLECDGVVQSELYGTCQRSNDLARYASVSVTNSYTPLYAGLLPVNFGDYGSMEFVGSASVRLQ